MLSRCSTDVALMFSSGQFVAICSNSWQFGAIRATLHRMPRESAELSTCSKYLKNVTDLRANRRYSGRIGSIRDDSAVFGTNRRVSGPARTPPIRPEHCRFVLNPAELSRILPICPKHHIVLCNSGRISGIRDESVVFRTDRRCSGRISGVREMNSSFLRRVAKVQNDLKEIYRG
jgi:hypothetical protein